jgi:tetratricopeptide (TPR) repeat protein
MASKDSERVREAAAGLAGEPSPGTLASLKRLEQAIAKNPQDPAPLVKKGKALECMFKFGPALRCYDSALAKAPKDLPALLAKASLLARSCREGQAVRVLDLAIAAGGNRAELSFEQGRILHERGSLRRAGPFYVRCLQLKKHHKKAVTNLAAVLVGLKRYREAIALCDGELKRDPKFVNLLCTRGIAEMELREFEKAVQDYQAALKLSPGNQTVFYNLACLEMKKKNPKRALAFLAKAVKANGDLAGQALKDRTLAGLRETARFWRIIMTGTYLDDATLWWLQKKFKIKSF